MFSHLTLCPIILFLFFLRPLYFIFLGAPSLPGPSSTTQGYLLIYEAFCGIVEVAAKSNRADEADTRQRVRRRCFSASQRSGYMYSIVYIVFIVIYTWYCRRIQGEFFNFLDAAICHDKHTHTHMVQLWVTLC